MRGQGSTAVGDHELAIGKLVGGKQMDERAVWGSHRVTLAIPCLGNGLVICWHVSSLHATNWMDRWLSWRVSGSVQEVFAMYQGAW